MTEHPSRTDEPFALPEGFRFGVATAGFQVEGHYNGPGEPRNNWYGWEKEGRVEPSGIAVDFWNRYEDHLDRAVAAGCNAMRISIEWARCEPIEGEWDATAFDRYRAIIAACHERGLDPLVTLHHFTHPWWLGEEFWLHLDSPRRYAAWVGKAVDELGDAVTNWVTINEVNILALQSFLLGMFPPGRRMQPTAAITCLDHLLAGHVLGYDEIHRRNPDAMVATNTNTMSVYEFDRMLSDVLLARLYDVGRGDLAAWCRERKLQYESEIVPVIGPENLLKRIIGRWFSGPWNLPRTVDAVYSSPHVCTLDVTQLDYYAPGIQGNIKPPGHRTAGGRTPIPGQLLWDQPPDAEGFKSFIPSNVAKDRELWIVENGLCNRVRNGRSYPRLDRYDRPRYLREYLSSVVDLIDGGTPLGGYYHWSLVDNYEWGSYEPRFGLYGVDRERGTRWLDTDSMGDDSAGTYRHLIEGLRAGDRSVLRP